MKKIIASPREGVTVRHPETGFPIKPKTTVKLSPQIKRYLKDGDLIEIPKNPQPKKSKASRRLNNV